MCVVSHIQSAVTPLICSGSILPLPKLSHFVSTGDISDTSQRCRSRFSQIRNFSTNHRADTSSGTNTSSRSRKRRRRNDGTKSPRIGSRRRRGRRPTPTPTPKTETESRAMTVLMLWGDRRPRAVTARMTRTTMRTGIWTARGARAMSAGRKSCGLALGTCIESDHYGKVVAGLLGVGGPRRSPGVGLDMMSRLIQRWCLFFYAHMQNDPCQSRCHTATFVRG